MTDAVQAVANHIRAEYSHCGVEVGATGERSLTLLVPATLQVTELSADLWNLFNATCELKQEQHGSSVVVWLSAESALADAPHATARKPVSNSWRGLFPIVAAVWLHVLVNEHYAHNPSDERWWHTAYNATKQLWLHANN